MKRIHCSLLVLLCAPCFAQSGVATIGAVAGVVTLTAPPDHSKVLERETIQLKRENLNLRYQKAQADLAKAQADYSAAVANMTQEYNALTPKLAAVEAEMFKAAEKDPKDWDLADDPARCADGQAPCFTPKPKPTAAKEEAKKP